MKVFINIEYPSPSDNEESVNKKTYTLFTEQLCIVSRCITFSAHMKLNNLIMCSAVASNKSHKTGVKPANQPSYVCPHFEGTHSISPMHVLFKLFIFPAVKVIPYHMTAVVT